MSENAYFEKQRDLLLQEIGVSMESVVYNLDTLNRSLAGSVAVGKEFEDVARLWSHFYDGSNELKRKQEENSKKENEEGKQSEDGEVEEDEEVKTP
ncbi:DASH complex subunit Dad1p [[Candida] anglica]|uniref:DASH complex subunit DAD1 n=1 Tax=[Candida] anglica TaxID=148631 RepID=A0ABP0EL31_9ASCO